MTDCVPNPDDSNRLGKKPDSPKTEPKKGPNERRHDEFLRCYSLNHHRIFGYILTLLPNSTDACETPDTSIYNGDHYTSFRKAGVGAPLARGSNNPDTMSDLFGSYHPGICQFALGDGSVRTFSVQIDLTSLGFLANREDGQIIFDE